MAAERSLAVIVFCSEGTRWSPWVSSSGVVAHPDAPEGGGGDGHFRIARSLGTDGNTSDLLPNPDAPAPRDRVLTDADTERLQNEGVPLDGSNTAAPPAKPANFKITGSEVDVEILADGTDRGAGREWSAKTVLNPTGVKAEYPTPEMENTGKPPSKKDKVIKLHGKYAVKGKVTLQVLYGTNAKPSSPAAYGRGTTSDDKSKKNTTVAFHESCHMDDFVQWMKKKTLPAFKGKVGMTEEEYDKACTDCDAAIDQYFADAETDSRTKTDEVGSPTLSDYKKSHPGYEH